MTRWARSAPPFRRPASAVPGLTAVLLLALLPAVPARAAVAAAADTAATVPDTLTCVLADWSAGAFGSRAGGAAAWVLAPDGSLRVDLAVADDPPAPGGTDRLLARAGRGWTFVAGGSGEGVYGAWDREWRSAPVGWTDLARAVAAGAEPGAGPVGRRLVLAAASPDTDPAGGPQPAGFRPGLARRGRGGGGPGERVTVRPAADRSVRVTSSRRPGALVIRPRSRQEVRGVAAEVFLPWWALGEVLRFPGRSGVGTSPDGPR